MNPCDNHACPHAQDRCVDEAIIYRSILQLWKIENNLNVRQEWAKSCYMHTMEENEEVLYTVTWKALKNVLLSEQRHPACGARGDWGRWLGGNYAFSYEDNVNVLPTEK